MSRKCPHCGSTETRRVRRRFVDKLVLIQMRMKCLDCCKEYRIRRHMDHSDLRNSDLRNRELNTKINTAK